MSAGRLGGAFGAMVIALLAMFAVVTPLAEVPDEVAHVLRADGLRQGAIIGRRDTITLDGQPRPSAGVDAHHGFLFATSPLNPQTRRMEAGTLQQAEDAGWGPLAYVHIPNTAVYGPFFYVPAAIAIAVADAAGLSPYWAMVSARGLNALCYALMAGLAVTLAVRGRLLLILLLGLPMALSLGASVNQDGLVIATSALIAALLSRDAASPTRGWAWWAAAVLMLPLLMAKPPHLPLALLLLGAPSSLLAGAGGFDRRRWLVTGLVMTVAVAWTLFNMLHVSVPFIHAPYPSGPWAGEGEMLTLTDPARQARILFADPWRLIDMPVRSLWELRWVWWMHFVGVLGPLAHPFNDILYYAWPVAAGVLLLLGFPRMAGGFRPSWGRLLDMALPPLLVLVCVWLIIIAQYLSWTSVGAIRVEGVQGRYFIPLLPFLILALTPRVLAPTGRRGLAEGGAMLLVLAGAVCGANLLIRAYYIG